MVPGTGCHPAHLFLNALPHRSCVDVFDVFTYLHSVSLVQDQSSHRRYNCRPRRCMGSRSNTLEICREQPARLSHVRIHWSLTFHEIASAWAKLSQLIKAHPDRSLET